ncbi:MAG: hypothetical protein ACLFPA_11010 [Dichotomicrobium sp.]
MEQQWSALGVLASDVLRRAAAARDEAVGQLRDVEAEQGAVAHERRAGRSIRDVNEARPVTPQQLELPFA